MGQTKRYINIFIILCGVLFIAFVVVTSEIAERRFKNSGYSGIVKEKVFKPNRRGFSDVLVDSVWHKFGIQEDDVNTIVTVGDSIVKKSGSLRILLYRKDSSGFWVEVSLDNQYSRSR